jgi:hypothetical protein
MPQSYPRKERTGEENIAKNKNNFDDVDIKDLGKEKFTPLRK